MQHEQLLEQIIEHLRACADENLLDLILKLLIESGY
jgi:hypothetical protein